MKRYFLFLSIVFAFTFVSWQTKAQSDTLITTSFDTVVIFHPLQLNGCIMNYDTNHITSTGECYFNYYQESRYPILDSNGNWNNIFKLIEGTIAGKNEYHIEGIAQPYHFDSTVYVHGVAARARGRICYSDSNWNGIIDTTYHFRLLDDKMNEVAVSINFIIPVTSRYAPYSLYSFGQGYPLKDFYIMGDVPTINISPSAAPTLAYDHTCSIYDTIWQDTIIGCQSNDSPLFKKNGQWIRFADDSVYNFYQKTFIEFLPILLLPHNTSGLNDIQLEDMCYVYPNPTNKEL